MISTEAVVKLRTGLQARPAALFVQEANRFTSDIFLQKDDKKVNAKSIMGLMSLAISSNSTVTIFADGKDEQEAMEALVEFIAREQ